MIYDPKTDLQLKSWLVKNLEPMFVYPPPPRSFIWGSDTEFVPFLLGWVSF